MKDVLKNPANGYSIQVEDTCNGSNVTILLWAAILAFPRPVGAEAFRDCFFAPCCFMP